MITSIIKYGFQFLFLVLLQGLVLNNVHLFGFASTYFYVVLLLLLPVDFNKLIVLLLAFLLGLSIDFYSSSWGVNTFSCVSIAYLRPLILRFLSPRDGYEFGSKPDLSNMGFNWFVSYAFIFVFIHHFVLQLTETFRITEFFDILVRSISSTLFTLFLVFVFQLFTYHSNRAK